jgi:hypothetical protein
VITQPALRTKTTEGEIMRTVKSTLENISSRGSGQSVALAVLALGLSGYTQLSLAEPSSQTTFKSAEEASHALFTAVQNDNEQAVKDILGVQDELINSDDKAEDKLEREQFVRKYQQMHRLVPETHGNMLLYIGAENWPFPIPLVSRNGAWHFDSDAGGQEVRYRRVGENEVTAIALCHDLVAAAKHAGTSDDADGLTAAVLTNAKSGNQPVPFHGYYFHVVSTTGSGFAAIAYPVAYRSSGVMTFIINQNDVVREKDLGAKTAQLAAAMASYHADRTWTLAETITPVASK